MPVSSKKLLTALRKNDGQNWQQLTADYLKTRKLTRRQQQALGLEVYHITFKQAVANLRIDEHEARELAAIKDYFNISDTDIRELRRSYAPGALKMMLDWFLIDDILTPSEQAQLFAFGEEMALTNEEVQALLDASVAGKDKKRPKPPQPTDEPGPAL